MRRKQREGKAELVIKEIIKIRKEIKHMAKTLDELKTAIAAIATAVDQDAAQDQLVVAAIEKLIEKINGLPNATDFTDQVSALEAAMGVLTNSNATIQTEIDKAGTV